MLRGWPNFFVTRVPVHFAYAKFRFALVSTTTANHMLGNGGAISRRQTAIRSRRLRRFVPDLRYQDGRYQGPILSPFRIGQLTLAIVN